MPGGRHSSSVLPRKRTTRLYSFARRALNNPQDAEDVTQEALTRAWTHFETFDPRCSFDAWVFRIASNLLIDQSRRRKRRQEISLDAPVARSEENEGSGCLELADSTSDPHERLMAKEISAELNGRCVPCRPFIRPYPSGGAAALVCADRPCACTAPREPSVRACIGRASCCGELCNERTCHEYANE